MSDTVFEMDRDKLEVRMAREFNVPRQKLWDAHTKGELIEKWWGPRKYKTRVQNLEPKVGGKWMFSNIADGEEHVFYGSFLDLKEPEYVTWTFTYAPFPDIAIVETVKFEELPNGNTKLSTLSKYPNKEALDAMTQSGMEEGAKESWDRLEELAI